MLGRQTLRASRPSDRSPGITTVIAAVIIVVILVALSLGTFTLLGGFSGKAPIVCTPPTSPECSTYENLHDVSVLAPFKSAAQASSVSFSASVPAGETAASFTYYFGDGSTLKTSTAIVSHNYTEPGQYLVYVQASVNGAFHDNVGNLVLLHVTPSAQVGNAGGTAPITTSIVANSTSPTAGTAGVTPVLAVDQSVTVTGSYSAAPTNPAFHSLSPKIVVSSGGAIQGTNTTTSATATATFSSPGSYVLTFVGPATNGSAVLYQNYTWTVFVAAVGTHAGIFGSAAPQSPHPGTIVSYEYIPGGAFSEDPAIDYETAGAQAIGNVYQTLITYNGTDVGPTADDFIPMAATCVPGSQQCQNLYGSTLQSGNNYTFVIQPNATFYDASTKAHWSMYPTDVEFSIARDLGFSTLPFPTDRPGWIVAQALLGAGNATWDLIHQAYNNTPQNILGSMVINGSACPTSALNGPNARGCITFIANGGGISWPDFLEFVADPLGAGIVSCGWFSAKAQGAGIPYWTRGNVSGPGDQPCAPIGTHGMGSPVSQIPFEGWDQWEELASGSFNGQYLGNVQWAMLGSGPYYLSNYIVAASYSLAANPYYEQNPDCTWAACQPKNGQYASSVQVTWETSETPGEQALRFGSADFATIPPTSTGLLLQLIQQGKLNAIQAPTLDIFFQAFDLDFQIAGAQHYSTNTITIPGDFFAYLGMREFFARAYPYTTVENTINTVDGIQYEFNEGGAIPQFMGNYYPSNIPWPNTDPCTVSTDPACPIYYWDQMQNPASPLFDPEATHCTNSNPCAFPLFASTGNPSQDETNALWLAEISKITGGAIQAFPVDINFVILVENSESAVAGTNPMPAYSLGWAPDYPDPTDYVVPLYTPNSTYTAGDAVALALEQPQFATGCAYGIHDYSDWANLSIKSGIPQSCQGVAYRAMVYALGLASSDTNLAQRNSIYDQAEQIAYGLCLYVYADQANAVSSASSWINTNSIDTNVMGSGGFYQITGNGVQYAGST